jgi:hypothetical protein
MRRIRNNRDLLDRRLEVRFGLFDKMTDEQVLALYDAISEVVGETDELVAQGLIQQPDWFLPLSLFAEAVDTEIAEIRNINQLVLPEDLDERPAWDNLDDTQPVVVIH